MDVQKKIRMLKETTVEYVKHENKVLCENLSLAVKEIEKANIKNILFSPGYPSGDDYINFEERGKAFNKLIEENSGT